MIVEIIFSDYYRTFLLCILSMGVTFFIRKFSVGISDVRIYYVNTICLDTYCKCSLY